jgi:large subunit ribosomal protein L17e
MSVFGRVGKSRRPSESDESEDDEMGTPAVAPKAAVEQPTINLQPLRKIVGFAA